ncbi:MAG: hypothetical protein AAFN94_07180 [Pseudomonadota bacterium]
MLTKEFENILESLPAFISMIWSAKNPFIVAEGCNSAEQSEVCKASSSTKKNKQWESLDTIVKAAWFIVPFHFLAFFGLAPSGNVEIGLVLLLGFITLVLVSWIGLLIGNLASWRKKLSDHAQAKVMESWTVSLVVSWFFCVLAISVVNFGLWYLGDFEGRFPILLRNLGGILINSWAKGAELLITSLIFPLFGAVSLVLVYGKAGRGSFPQVVAVCFFCWLIAVSMVLLSTHFLTLTVNSIS